MEKDLFIPASSEVPPSEGFREALLLHLADNALILAQRNSEWCGHGPVLEQDIAITNISLDLIGQARNFYQYVAHLLGKDWDEDKLAFLRNEHEFKNCLLVELPKGDWAQTILRQFFFSAYEFYLFQQLSNSKDEQIAAIATKALKEISYHLRWSSEWVIRLGDGTEESHQRMNNAIEFLWPYTAELFIPSEYEKNAAQLNIGADVETIKLVWEKKVNEIFTEASLIPPSGDRGASARGKEGHHTEHFGPLLAEMQYMQRTYPNSVW